MVVDAALGIRGRPRRVEDQRRVVGPYRGLETLELLVVDRVAAGDECGIVETDHDAAVLGEVGVLEERRELRVEQEEVHAGMCDDVRELACLVACVDGHGHRADAHRAKEHCERLDSIAVQEADAVAVLDACCAEPTGHHAGQGRELRERAALVGKHDPLTRGEVCGAVDEARNSPDLEVPRARAVVISRSGADRGRSWRRG